MFSLRLAGSSGQQEVLVHTHTLRDGGLLVQLDGTSHVVYAEEETAGTRLLVDGRTCLLQVRLRQETLHSSAASYGGCTVVPSICCPASQSQGMHIQLPGRPTQQPLAWPKST